MGHALRGCVHQNTTTQLPSIALHSFIAYSRSIKSLADVNLYLARQQLIHKFLSVALVAMFITVRFGDDKSELFNPNCRNVILLDNIRERCNCDEDDVIDLSDENGSVANLPGHLDDYGRNFLTDRGSFILVRVERDGDEGDDDRLTYIPLLQGIDDDKDFLSRLNPKPTKGGERGKGRRKGDRSGSPSSAKGDRRKGRQKQESQSRRSGGTASRNTPSKR